MKERIILAPGLNGNELYSSLALHGINCIGLKICGSAELARLALLRSGITLSEDFVDSREEAAIIAEAVNGEPYFGKASYSDIQEITACIRRMRCLVTEDDESLSLHRILPQGIFAEKNTALLNVYQKYIKALSAKKAIDSVTLIRYAVRESGSMDAEFLTLDEYPLTPLEIALINRVSGGMVTKTALQALFGVDDRPVSISSIKNCYGAANEVEAILADIYDGKRIDQCTVAVTDTATYSQLFFDYALQYDIPVTFGCGIPITNSNPAKLAALYYHWITDGFFGTKSVNEILSSKAFDRAKFFDQLSSQDGEFNRQVFFDLLGSIHFTNNAAINEKRLSDLIKTLNEELGLFGEESKETDIIKEKLRCIPFLEISGRELALPAEEFISKYAFIRKGNSTNTERQLMALDLSAAAAIYDELKAIRGAELEQSAEEIIPNLLMCRVGARRSEEGMLHITGIDDAFPSLRENLYIAGLSASKFPGSPKENPLLLDADLRLFGDGIDAFTADGRILWKKNQLMILVHLASSLGSKIHVSFAGMNVSELKKDNPSSLVFELFRADHGSSATAEDLEKQIQKISYFAPAISISRFVGNAYTKGQKLSGDVPEHELSQSVGWIPDKAFSPSALETYFGCPRKFMLHYLLGIPEPEDSDPFEIISAADSGTLAHSLMHVLSGSDLSLDEFMKLSEDAFNRFLNEHPPLIAESVPAVKEQFLEMMETAYNTDPHREVVLEEEDVYCTHESGIRIHGYPDRVEKLDDGSLRIVDFKSGRRIKHLQDDIETCLQIVLYAYIMEQKGFTVSDGEYRYIRLGETVTCRFDQSMKQQLNEHLNRFRDSLEKGYFPFAETPEDGDDPCRYCKYIAVCGKGYEEGMVE